MWKMLKRFLANQSTIAHGIQCMSEQLDHLTAVIERERADFATLTALVTAILPLVKPPVAPEDLSAVTAAIEALATDNETLNATIQAALDAVKASPAA